MELLLQSVFDWRYLGIALLLLWLWAVTEWGRHNTKQELRRRSRSRKRNRK